MSAAFKSSTANPLSDAVLHAGEVANIDDWEAHLTTIFPEVRLKRYIEMRGADGGPWNMICALPALWVGLLYSKESQAKCLELIQGWTQDDRDYLRNEVCCHSLIIEQSPGTPGTSQGWRMLCCVQVMALTAQTLAQWQHYASHYLT